MLAKRNCGIYKAVAIALLLGLSGCSSVVTRTELLEVGEADIEAVAVSPSAAPGENLQGTQVAVWEEPMVDVVDVPPGLDPEGHYYRPAHQSVVEIRQGRWQYYRKGPTSER